MSLHNLIANGGKVVIVGGYNKEFEEFRAHPQLEFWTADDKTEMISLLKRKNGSLPRNARAVIISHFVSHSAIDKVMKDARNRKLIVFPNKLTGEVTKILKEITTAPPKPVIIHDKPLAVVPTLEEKLIVETTPRIEQVLEENIETLEVSIKKPRQIRKRKEIQDNTGLVGILDEMIVTLQLAREQIVTLTAENNELRQYKLTMQKRVMLLMLGADEQQEEKKEDAQEASSK